MSQTIESRLAEMGIVLPQAAAPAANYVPFTKAGSLLFISGQLPMQDGTVVCKGHLGRNVPLEAAQDAARLCAINILAQASSALDGDLERIVQVVKIQGFVASTADYIEQHLVINGASNFLVEALGERGKHARAAVGMASLPMDAAVEVDAILEIR